MSQRPTPETDKVESLMIYVLNDITVALEHARKMERERDDALSLAASCQRAAVLQIDELNAASDLSPAKLGSTSTNDSQAGD